MTTKTENHEMDRLLSAEERAILSRIADEEPPHSQRAAMLLATDKGATQAEAGHEAGLTTGQVRYWLSRFRKNRLTIFPEDLLSDVQQQEVDSPESPAEAIASADVPELETATDEETVAIEEPVQPDLPDTEVTIEPEVAPGPVEEAKAEPEVAPEGKKKAKKKPKKTGKPKKKKTKGDKKRKKGKKSKKKSKKKNKKKKSKKGKGAKGKAGKKGKKKGKK